MKPDEIKAGRTYRIAEGCGVPFEALITEAYGVLFQGSPLTLRVTLVESIDVYSDSAWLRGYQLDDAGRAVATRTVYVGQVHGMRPVVVELGCTCPASRIRIPHNIGCPRLAGLVGRQASIADRYARQFTANTGPVIPRQRTSPDPITPAGRPR